MLDRFEPSGMSNQQISDPFSEISSLAFPICPLQITPVKYGTY